MIKTKVCTKCGKEKELDWFHKDKSIKSGLRSQCKDCLKKWGRKWREDSQKKIKKDQKIWREDDKGKTKWKVCVSCKEKKSLDQFSKDKTQKDELCIHCKVCVKRWGRKWRSNNKDKSNRRARERRKTDPLYRLRTNISTTLNFTFKNMGILKTCPSKLDMLNITIEQFETHFIKLINQPCPVCGCEWDNTFEIDHIIPQSLARKDDIQKGEYDVINLNQLYNLRMTCSNCNMKKGNKIPKVYDPRLQYLIDNN